MVNHKFKIAMFLRMLTYAQKWLNSYVFYTFIVHGNITANQLFAPKLPPKNTILLQNLIDFVLDHSWIISCCLEPVNTLLTIAPFACYDFVCHSVDDLVL